jgi:hypothetical protein
MINFGIFEKKYLIWQTHQNLLTSFLQHPRNFYTQFDKFQFVHHSF